MLQTDSLFAENEVFSAYADSNVDFVVNEVSWLTDQHTDEYLYQQLTYKVISKPKVLISHIQRIYFTYSHKMIDQLFAALLDLLVVLEGRGSALSQRMIASTQSLLSDQQANELKAYLKNNNQFLLKGNKFSIFIKGFEGTNQVLIEQNEKVIEHDELKIARDFIEYSQLDEAIQTLESGILKSPDRMDLQLELLELYKATKKNLAFTAMQEKLLAVNTDLFSGWQELSNYFAGLNNEE